MQSSTKEEEEEVVVVVETCDGSSKVTTDFEQPNNNKNNAAVVDIYDFAAAKFSVGQKVFANDTGNVYEAVIRKSMIKTDPHHHWAYLVHYLGWNSRWDKWMTEDYIEEDTLEVRSRAQKVKEEAKKAEILKKEKKRESEREKKERKLKKTKKQKTTHDNKDDDEDSCDLSITSSFRDRMKKKMSIKDTLTSCCELPFTLKTVLMDDREKINNKKKISNPKKEPNLLVVHALPVSINIKLIIAQFVKIKHREMMINNEKDKEVETQDDSLKNSTTNDTDDSEEQLEKWRSFERGILNLFDVMLPKYLLYNQEREQYLNLYKSVNDNDNSTLSPSEIYPGEFLLRMMVRLPMLLSTSLRVKIMCDEEPSYGELCDLGDRLKQLIIFLQKNRVSCFKGRYRFMNENEYTSSMNNKTTVMRPNAA